MTQPTRSARSAVRPSIREAQKEATARLLLDSAAELFLEHGYGHTTIEQIATNAGASRATFYLHFEKKADTAVALISDQIVAETTEFYRRLDAMWPPTQPRLRDWLDDALTFYERHREVLEVWRQALASEPSLARFQAVQNEQFAEVMVAYLGGWDEAGQHEARLRLSVLIVELTDIAMGWLNGVWPVDRVTITGILLDLWTAGLRLGRDPDRP
ncbi:TetR/AcrR family transcriptional regulator [Nakamurella leprariae]|uniref:TetR/AcrR family transcriptional regulator n=1 Tax=Nakamurella leprariae TaxID=2803911 RepID=A0A938Y777_9ACTN|nr:TetR/AcrR family transcriptional regulator [Nakamurella leprariae]MBM9467085.1 TetR/AcrR family transcriptional regulator [Nakamurella leprariae]